MRIELSNDEVKDIILDYLTNTLTAESLDMLSKDSITFYNKEKDNVIIWDIKTIIDNV